MNTAILTIRTEPAIKKRAQKVANALGFSISSLVNGYLREVIRTKTVHFSESYEPTPYLKRILKRAEKDIQDGKNMSPTFDNSKDAIAWLNRKK